MPVIIIGTALIFLIITLIVCCCCCSKNKKKTDPYLYKTYSAVGSDGHEPIRLDADETTAGWADHEKDAHRIQ